MKARLLTLAVAGALVLPVTAQAEGEGASWYGSIRTSLGWKDVDGGDSSLNVNDHSSRIGVKGANDLGNGLKVPYRFEFKADSDEAKGIESGRLGRVGLQGGFGAIHIGQLWGPYYNYLGQYVDLFNTVGATFYQGNFRLSNALRYDLPSTGGFSAQVALIADGENNDDDGNETGEDGIDAYQIGLGYNTDAFGVALAYFGDQFNDDNDLLGVTVGTSFAGFDIGLLWEDNDAASDDAIHLVASYGAGANTYRIGYAELGDDDAVQLGWQHKLGKASRVAIELESSDSQDNLNFFIRTDF